MSHITDCEVLIEDLDVLERACQHFGARLNREATLFNTYDENQVCEGRIEHPNPNRYQIGLRRARYCTRTKQIVEDKSAPAFALFEDDYERDALGIQDGLRAGMIQQRYGFIRATEQAAIQGYVVQEHWDEETGTVKLRALVGEASQPMGSEEGWA